MKSFIVTTNSDYTILCLADNQDEAVQKASSYYEEQYEEERDDWEAYELDSYLEDEGDILPIKTWLD